MRYAIAQNTLNIHPVFTPNIVPKLVVLSGMRPPTRAVDGRGGRSTASWTPREVLLLIGLAALRLYTTLVTLPALPPALRPHPSSQRCRAHARESVPCDSVSISVGVWRAMPTLAGTDLPDLLLNDNPPRLSILLFPCALQP